MRRFSPLTALAAGVVAGAVGTLAQDLFFALTGALQPPPSPSKARTGDTATESVARGVVEGLAKRGPLEDKALGGKLVHYAFGSGFGGLYGLTAASLPAVDSPVGALGFGTSVWLVGGNLILPLFRLASWPQKYPLKTHAYAFGAHMVYGFAVWGTLEAIRARVWGRLAATFAAAYVTRKVPAFARAPVRKLLATAWRTKMAAEDALAT